MFARFATGFLYAFLMDGVVSLLDEILRAANLSFPVLSGLRALISSVALLWALGMFAALFLTPRLGKRRLLPATLFTLWGSLYGFFPLLLLSLPFTGIAVSVAQAALGVVALTAKSPLFEEKRPAFSWKNLAAGAAIAMAFFFLGIASMATAAAQALDSFTGGYAQLRPSGFYLNERTLRKGDKEVRLIGMVHLARAGFYDSISTDLPTRGVVLLEGVSDTKGVLKNKFSYKNIARFLGVTPQETSSFTEKAREAMASPEKPALDYRHADMDLSALQPQTLQLIETMAVLMGSTSIKQVTDIVLDPKSPLQNKLFVESAMEDLIVTRNLHLLTTIQAALLTSDVVIVPWGAAHLPELQKELEALGFQETSQKSRPAFQFF